MGRATQRAIEILELLATQTGRWTHAEIARRLAIPKSTLTDLLRDLTAQEYLEIGPGGDFLVGPQVLLLSRAYMARLNVVSFARDALVRLCESSDEAASLAVRQENDIVVVAQERPSKLLVAAMTLGDRAPMISTATGKAILAYLGEATIENIIARSRTHPSAKLHVKSAAALRIELEGIRNGAIAVNTQEWMEEVSAIALPGLRWRHAGGVDRCGSAVEPHDPRVACGRRASPAPSCRRGHKKNGRTPHRLENRLRFGPIMRPNWRGLTVKRLQQ